MPASNILVLRDNLVCPHFIILTCIRQVQINQLFIYNESMCDYKPTCVTWFLSGNGSSFTAVNPKYFTI